MDLLQRFGKLAASIVLSLSLLLGASSFMGNGAAEAASVSTMASSKTNQIISMGKRFMRKPYKFGVASGRTNAFDCSSFTQYVFKQNGIHLPRTSKQQSTVGSYVARNKLQPGDLVFFYSPIHHVGIYMGNGKLLHTYGSPGVTISNLNSGWWSSHYKTARRVL